MKKCVYRVYTKKYVNNKYPSFIPHKKGKKGSQFITFAMQLAAKIDIARVDHSSNYLKKNITINRIRRLNKHRASAMRAMVQAMLYHLNEQSFEVQSTIEQLSDECGLSTISPAGNKSITRASRLITQFMEPMGLCSFVASKNCIHKVIKIKNLFFEKIGIPHLKNKIYTKHYCNHNISHVLNNFIIYKEFPKIFNLDENKIKKRILNALIKYYSTTELTKMGSKGLKKKVNTEYLHLKKISEKYYL
uniref:RepA2 protein n=1 Tax=Buchnera aphidicola TaxID=9 RepID=O31290_9GAMM|nr:RepA2 protein [Buchnera aphidicola]